MGPSVKFPRVLYSGVEVEYSGGGVTRLVFRGGFRVTETAGSNFHMNVNTRGTGATVCKDTALCYCRQLARGHGAPNLRGG